MTDLTAFAHLPLAELTAEIEAMHPTFNAARSGTGVPSPADTSARGTSSEQSA